METTNLKIPWTYQNFAKNEKKLPREDTSLDIVKWEADLTNYWQTWQRFQYEASLIRENFRIFNNPTSSQGTTTEPSISENMSSLMASTTYKHELKILLQKDLSELHNSKSILSKLISKVSAKELDDILESLHLPEPQLIDMITRFSEILPYTYTIILHKRLALCLVKYKSLPSRQTRNYLKKLVATDPTLFINHFLCILLSYDVSSQWTLDLLPLLPISHQVELWRSLLESSINKSTIPLHFYFVTQPLPFHPSKLLSWAEILGSHSETLKSLQLLLKNHTLTPQDQLKLMQFLHQRPKHPLIESIKSLLDDMPYHSENPK